MIKNDKKDIKKYGIIATAAALTSLVGFYLGDILIDTSTINSVSQSLELVTFGFFALMSIVALIFCSIAIYNTPAWSIRFFLIFIAILSFVSLSLNGSTALLSGFTVSF